MARVLSRGVAKRVTAAMRSGRPLQRGCISRSGPSTLQRSRQVSCAAPSRYSMTASAGPRLPRSSRGSRLISRGARTRSHSGTGAHQHGMRARGATVLSLAAAVALAAETTEETEEDVDDYDPDEDMNFHCPACVAVFDEGPCKRHFRVFYKHCFQKFMEAKAKGEEVNAADAISKKCIVYASEWQNCTTDHPEQYGDLLIDKDPEKEPLDQTDQKLLEQDIKMEG